MSDQITSDVLLERIEYALRDRWPADPEQVPFTEEQWKAVTAEAAKHVLKTITPVIADCTDSASGRAKAFSDAIDALKRTANFAGVKTVEKLKGAGHV